MRRTARAKRFADYRRLLNQYNKLGYYGAEIHFAAHDRDREPLRQSWTVKAIRPGDMVGLLRWSHRDSVSLRYARTVHPRRMRPNWTLLSIHLERFGKAAESASAAMSAIQMVDTGAWKVLGITDSGPEYAGTDDRDETADLIAPISATEAPVICISCGAIFAFDEELCPLCGDPR